MSKFTPGPWSINRVDEDNGLIYWCIELVDMSCIARTGSDVSTVQDKANAALIAAAPDMYDVLKKVERTFGDRFPEVVDVLAKADGRDKS